MVHIEATMEDPALAAEVATAYGTAFQTWRKDTLDQTIEDAIATWSYANTGVFVQDTWKVSKALNLTFGVRVDQQRVPSRPIYNVNAATARVPGRVIDATGAAGANSVARDSGGFGLDNTVTLDNTELVQPRFGFNWNPVAGDYSVDVIVTGEQWGTRWKYAMACPRGGR